MAIRTKPANDLPDLNDVSLFVRVVQTHSFSAAARERGVPVSTISRRIARLESSLSTRLLERTTRALRLTDAGRVYFDHASRAMDDLVQGTGQVRERQATPRGRVRILAPTALAAAVANVSFTFLAAHPQVSIDVELGQNPSDLAMAGFDLAIVTGKPDATSDFVAREIWRSTRKLLLASPRYVASRGAPRHIDDLAQHDCVATRTKDGFATWTLVKGRDKRRFTFAPRFSVSEFAAAHRAVLAGLGIALFPESSCADDLASKRLIRVLETVEGEPGGVYLLYRTQRSLSFTVRAVVTHFLATLPATDPMGQNRSARRK